MVILPGGTFRVPPLIPIKIRIHHIVPQKTAAPKEQLFLFNVFRQLSEAKQKTTRYAGGRQVRYTKTHLSDTMRMFRPIAKER